MFLGVAPCLAVTVRKVTASQNSLCGSAATQVVVITGDNKLTAEAICLKIGVFETNEGLEGKSMTGRAFVELSNSERRRVLQARPSRLLSQPNTSCSRSLALPASYTGKELVDSSACVDDLHSPFQERELAPERACKPLLQTTQCSSW